MGCQYTEKRRVGFSILFSFIVLLGFSAFVFCLVAEFQKPKARDLEWDGEFCYSPGTRAFRLGIAALICLCVAQIVGNLVICRNFWTRDKTGFPRGKTAAFGGFLLLFSWIIFAVAIALISTAASMSREQRYGEEWLNRECYLVKDGVFSASAVLSLLSLAAVLGAATINVKPKQIETHRKLHTQSV